MIVAAVTGAAAVFLLAYALLDTFFGRSFFQRRLESLRSFAVQRPVEKGRLLRAVRDAAARTGERLGTVVRPDSRPLLDAAAMPVRPAEWLVIRVAAALAVGLVLGLLLPWFLGVPVGLIAGFLIPDALL